MGQKQSSTCEDNSVKNPVKISQEWYEDQLLKRTKHIDFDVEAWYKILQNETFYTEFISISPSVAQAFVNFYQTYYNSKKLLSSNDIQLIESIQNQLKQQICNSNLDRFQRNGTFIRLSSRSPKDGRPLDSQILKQVYQLKLNELQIQYPDEYDSVDGKANMQMIAYCDAQFQSMKVTNEIQALNFILSSERVFVDLLEVLACQQVQDNTVTNVNNISLHEWNNNIIVREWNDLLDPSMEFRCFVYQSKLTAISQYNHYCKYYHLQDDVVIQQVKQTIINYWEERIKPLFDPLSEKYGNYIVDIGLIKNEVSNDFDCIVIEMNPFETSTGASLFHWTGDADQLKGDGNEIEIRIRLDYPLGIKDYVEYILEANKLNKEENLSAYHTDEEPYFIFLDKIKRQLHCF